MICLYSNIIVAVQELVQNIRGTQNDARYNNTTLFDYIIGTATKQISHMNVLCVKTSNGNLNVI